LLPLILIVMPAEETAVLVVVDVEAGVPDMDIVMVAGTEAVVVGVDDAARVVATRAVRVSANFIVVVVGWWCEEIYGRFSA
jgi:hypothetical protein